MKTRFIYLLIIVFTSCLKLEVKSENKDFSLNRYILNSDKKMNDIYCFSDIYNNCLINSKHRTIDFKEIKDTFDIEKKLNYHIKLNEYIEDKHFFILKDTSALLVIGVPHNSVGIGIDYNYYILADLMSKKEYEYSSLSNTEYSIFIGKDQRIKCIVLNDFYPRPADEKIKEDTTYYLLNVSIIDVVTNKIDTIFNYKCDFDNTHSTQSSNNPKNPQKTITNYNKFK